MRIRSGLCVILAVCVGLLALVSVVEASSSSRVADIRQRGHLVCGVQSGFAGFATVDAQGRYFGLDVDVCRAIAAAILGDASRVRFEEVRGLQHFLASDVIDVVSRRLTWSLMREERFGVRFGPVIYYDGQGFLVRGGTRINSLRQASKHKICVTEGGEFLARLIGHFHGMRLKLQFAVFPDAQSAESAFSSGVCEILSADVSELASVKRRLSSRLSTRLLPDRISREPLAPLVRAEDEALLQVLRWALGAMIAAEEAGVSASQAARVRSQPAAILHAKLGIASEAGRSIGLESGWLLDVLSACGNYGEMYERNLGSGSPLGLERGLNALWIHGGLMYAPSLH